MYKAHFNHKNGKTQSILRHSLNVAKMSEDMAIPELKNAAYVAGLYHDIGKYQALFQQRLEGKDIQVEHSSCGAKELMNKMHDRTECVMVSMAIMGHHTGLPDQGFDNPLIEDATFFGRLYQRTDDYSAYKKDIPDVAMQPDHFDEFLSQDIDPTNSNYQNNIIDKIAFVQRVLLSYLADADCIDAAQSMGSQADFHLTSHFHDCYEKITQHMKGLRKETELQKTRDIIHKQAFQHSQEDADIYLMTEPTGAGKTLSSMTIALDMALRMNKKRIIYVVPYNTIIDQTYTKLNDIFGSCAHILRHQSTFTYPDTVEGREAELSAENWNADIIITTQVQFMESCASNRKGKLRKLHNMADSIIIFDEAHTMPRDFLEPFIQFVCYLTKYFNSKVIMMSATMPRFKALIPEFGLRNMKVIDLITDQIMFGAFRKCEFHKRNYESINDLISHAHSYPMSLIVVNRKKDARRIYDAICGKKYHLSTYMTAIDRGRVIDNIHQDLKQLRERYPDGDIPDHQRISVVSTSLIEAGVDLDFDAVFREMNGLENIIQAGGRCNREGYKETGDVFIFKSADIDPYSSSSTTLTEYLLNKYDDIQEMSVISEYYDRKISEIRHSGSKKTMHYYFQEKGMLPYKLYAEEFNLIESDAISIVIPLDDTVKQLINQIEKGKVVEERKFQKYICSISKREFAMMHDLIAGESIYYLKSLSDYDREKGIQVERENP